MSKDVVYFSSDVNNCRILSMYFSLTVSLLLAHILSRIVSFFDFFSNFEKIVDMKKTALFEYLVKTFVDLPNFFIGFPIVFYVRLF